LDNPQGDYIHEVNVNFSYTFYKTFYFTAGTQVVFETKKADPYASDPYMYLFRCNEPIYLSTWADDDGGAGRQSKISATIQNTDFYILLVRAYNSSYPGTSDLWKDGSLYASDIPVAGTALYCGDIVTSDSLNFFTCRLIGDSRLWLQSYYTGNGIVAYNDDYGGPGDFGWGMASRVRARVYRIRYAIASAYQSAIPTGTCDVFMCCRDSAVMSSFPKLKADDAIRSAPESSAYNCISWAGGRTDLGRYFWPPDSANPWRGATDLESFDNFFGNRKGGQTLVRYNGAMNYTRNGANTGNAAVALWALNGKYTHASVTKPGNDHPHGYDWESKPGGLMRTFHPRDALEGDGYGAIVAYYRWDGTRSYGTPPAAPATEGTQEPMAEVERAEFGEADQQKLHELLRRVPDEVIQEFDRLYQAWAKTWNDPQLQIHSDPRMFARSLEYESLVAYCRERGRMVWPLLFDRYFRGDELTMNPIEDLTFAEHPNLMTETREKNLRPATGAIPSQSANWARYVSGILSLLYDDLVLGRD
jgi:hypothetical protein